jgi:hypothetical protein
MLSEVGQVSAQPHAGAVEKEGAGGVDRNGQRPVGRICPRFRAFDGKQLAGGGIDLARLPEMLDYVNADRRRSSPRNRPQRDLVKAKLRLLL